MAYNRRNILSKIIDIQTTVLEHTKRGVTQQWVYINVIYPTHKISRTTFYTYLACNAKAELKQLDQQAEQQLKMFEN